MKAGGRQRGLAAYALAVSATAGAGAVGLVTGALPTSDTIDERLPFHSPVFGGVALAAVVGAPTLLVAWFAWRGDPRVDSAAVIAGALLVGWIAVELAIIRELSWLQPVYVAVGVSFVMTGRRRARHDRAVRERASPARS